MSCCYGILFNNNLYYYIGSTFNIMTRVKDHHSNIQKIICKVIKSGINSDVKNNYDSNNFEKYITSRIINHREIEYTILPLYICTNF